MKTDHKATIEAVNAAFNANDMEAFVALCSDDIEMGVVGRPPSKGKEAILRDMNDDGSWHPPVIHVTDILIDGDRAVCHGTMDMDESNGNKHQYGYADCYTFNAEGKINKIQVYMHEIKPNPETNQKENQDSQD